MDIYAYSKAIKIKNPIFSQNVATVDLNRFYGLCRPYTFSVLHFTIFLMLTKLLIDYENFTRHPSVDNAIEQIKLLTEYLHVIITGLMRQNKADRVTVTV